MQPSTCNGAPSSAFTSPRPMFMRSPNWSIFSSHYGILGTSMQTAVICLQKIVELSSEKEGRHSSDRNAIQQDGNLVKRSCMGIHTTTWWSSTKKTRKHGWSSTINAWLSKPSFLRWNDGLEALSPPLNEVFNRWKLHWKSSFIISWCWWENVCKRNTFETKPYLFWYGIKISRNIGT